MTKMIKDIKDAKAILEKIFSVSFPPFDYTKYGNAIPKSLMELYAIENYFRHINCKYETIPFFATIDRLVDFHKLEVNDERLIFLRENQGNWQCSTSLKNETVFVDDYGGGYVEGANQGQLETFLISYLLLEARFNTQYYIGIQHTSIDELEKQVFESIYPLWLNQQYINRKVSVYLVDNCSLLTIDETMMTVSTEREVEMIRYKNTLPHYSF
jgi:hypothetical protein